MADQTSRYLPLTESTAYILMALTEPLHGYAVMQKVEQMSQSTVKLGPGTLYGAFTTLEQEKLIVKVDEVDRRKSYKLTEKGRTVLAEHMRRVALMIKNYYGR